VKIVIHGYYGAGNVGDDAILESIIDSIYKRYPKANISVISRGISAAYRGPHKVNTVHVGSVRQLKKTVQAADKVILGGGGLLQDYHGWKPQKHLGLKAKGMNYYGQVVNLAKRYNKPVYIYAIGIGPLTTPGGKKYAISVLSKATKVTVRDKDSYQFVKKHCPNQTIQLTADPALNLKGISSQKARAYLKKKQVPLNKQLIGICLRPWMFKPGEREKLLDRIASTAKTLSSNKKNHIILLPFSSYAGDVKIMQDLARRLNPGRYTLLTNSYQAKALKGICGQFSLMIGMRLHALILSAGSGVPVIGLTYDPKMNHFLRQIGQGNYIVSYRTLSPKTLVSKANKLLAMSPDRRRSLVNRVQQLKYTESGNINSLFTGG
jgi:polysaccharide pyruvyl transferase CsaB